MLTPWKRRMVCIAHEKSRRLVIENWVRDVLKETKIEDWVIIDRTGHMTHDTADCLMDKIENCGKWKVWSHTPPRVQGHERPGHRPAGGGHQPVPRQHQLLQHLRGHRQVQEGNHHGGFSQWRFWSIRSPPILPWLFSFWHKRHWVRAVYVNSALALACWHEVWEYCWWGCCKNMTLIEQIAASLFLTKPKLLSIIKFGFKKLLYAFDAFRVSLKRCDSYKSFLNFKNVYFQCEPISGLGFRRGSYRCTCLKGGNV